MYFVTMDTHTFWGSINWGMKCVVILIQKKLFLQLLDGFKLFHLVHIFQNSFCFCCSARALHFYLSPAQPKLGREKGKPWKQERETMERGRETMEVRNLCDRAGTEELGPGAGRNGENPWDLLAAHAGSVWENLRVNRHSLVTCSSCCLWENALSSPGQLCCVGVLVVVGDQGSAFNEIPLILLPPALLVSYIQNSTPLFEPALVSNCLDLFSQC